MKRPLNYEGPPPRRPLDWRTVFVLAVLLLAFVIGGLIPFVFGR